MKNPEELADAIIHELKRNSRTSANTQKIIDQHFRIDGMYQQYLCEYGKALKGETV